MSTRRYDDELLLDDHAALVRDDPAGNSWLYRIDVRVPSLGDRRWLAWTGYRSYEMRHWQEIGAGPLIFWSIPHPTGLSPLDPGSFAVAGVVELTLQLPNVDQWIAQLPDGRIGRFRPSEIAGRIAQAVGEEMATP